MANTFHFTKCKKQLHLKGAVVYGHIHVYLLAFTFIMQTGFFLVHCDMLEK